MSGRLREHLSVWKRHTSDKFVLDAITVGVTLPFRHGTEPPNYCNPRNSIPQHRLDWTRQAVLELVNTGAAIRTTARPKVVMPLIVQQKPHSTKWRLIHDCRYLSQFLDAPPFVTESIQDFFASLLPRLRLAQVDICSAYHHISIREDFHTYLGFCLDGAFYRYTVLPFGLSISAYAFNKVVAITADALRRRRIAEAISHYYDDFTFAMSTRLDVAQRGAAELVRIIRSFGWILQDAKVDLTLGTTIDALGFTIDTASMTAAITANRRARFLRAIVLLQRRVHISHRRVPARNLAAVVGQAIATYPVRGIKAYSATRYLIHALRPASTTQNFDTLVHVPARARRELQQWATWLHARSFAPMQPRVPAISHVLHVDASASGLGVVVTGDASSELIGRVFQRPLRSTERPLSSTAREMLGYEFAITALLEHAGPLLRHVLVVGDNQAADAIFSKGGSSKPDPHDGALHIAETTSRILDLAETTGYTVSFVWTPRTHNTQADQASRLTAGVPRDRFRVSDTGLAAIRNIAPAGAVLFWPFQQHVQLAHARTPDIRQAATAADAFARPWATREAYAVLAPPRWLIAATLDRIRAEPLLHAALIVPYLPDRSWYRRIQFRAFHARVRETHLLPKSAIHAEDRGPQLFILFTIGPASRCPGASHAHR